MKYKCIKTYVRLEGTFYKGNVYNGYGQFIYDEDNDLIPMYGEDLTTYFKRIPDVQS